MFQAATAAGLFLRLYIFGPKLAFIPFLFLLYFFVFLRYVSLAYIAWWIIDRHTPERGGRSWDAYRTWFVHKLCVEYFPITIHKTVDLPENENYIFACFPHGVVAITQLLTICYYNGAFLKIFPKINVRLCGMSTLFHLPVVREIFLCSGHISASEKSIKYFLKTPKNGAAVSLMVGGLREVYLTQRGHHKLYLKKRRGFYRVALQTGAHLVPVYSFGENDAFDVGYQFISEKTFWYLEKRFGILGLLSAIFLNPLGGNFFGYLPRRVPVNIVYGAPIPVQKTENPTEEEVSQLQQIFMTSLTNLFEQEKHKYIENANEAHLEFV